MDETPILRSNGNGVKAFASALVVGALITGVYAMVNPMNTSITSNKETIITHENSDAHPIAREKMARFSERFREIETQFRESRSISEIKLSNLNEKIGVNNKKIEKLFNEMKIMLVELTKYTERLKYMEKGGK